MTDSKYSIVLLFEKFVSFLFFYVKTSKLVTGKTIYFEIYLQTWGVPSYTTRCSNLLLDVQSEFWHKSSAAASPHHHHYKHTIFFSVQPSRPQPICRTVEPEGPDCHQLTDQAARSKAQLESLCFHPEWPLLCFNAAWRWRGTSSVTLLNGFESEKTPQTQKHTHRLEALSEGGPNGTLRCIQKQSGLAIKIHACFMKPVLLSKFKF